MAQLKAHMTPEPQFKLLLALISAITIVACNSGTVETRATNNQQPSIQLQDGDVLGNGNSVIRIPTSDDTGITTVFATLIKQGKLPACESQVDLNLTSDSLLDACLTDQPTCSVEFIPDNNELVVYPPPLYAPIGLEYEISVIDRDGAVTDPVNAVFCFDVGANSAPVPAADTYQLNFPGTIQTNGITYDDRCEKQSGSDGVLFNDDDDEHVTNTCLRAELIDPPQFATNATTFQNTFKTNGGFVYEGNTSASNDSFTYRVSDGVNPASAPIRVDIVYTSENRAPIAVDDTYTIAEDSDKQALNVLGNDVDPEALPLTIIQINNGPIAGTATIRNGLVIEYRPNADFNGTDSFDYVISDSAGVTAQATVQITITPVNDAPSAVNDDAAIDENTTALINVIDNDSDPDGDTILIAGVTNPGNGDAVIQSEGQVLYTPDTNFSGVDAFEYTIDDGQGATDTATVRVVVNSINLVPQPANDAFTTSEGQAIFLEVLDNDEDGDGDDLTLLAVSQPDNGRTSIAGTNIRYVPNDNFTGTDSFTYTVTDGTDTADAEVTISVSSTNDAPVAEDDDVTLDDNQPAVISVLDNDSDPDGDTLAIAITRAPDQGTATIQSDGILYTPEATFTGSDSFEYQVTDAGGLTDTAIVTITIEVQNTPPVAVEDNVSTVGDVSLTIDVLANDSDADGDALQVAIVDTADNGTAIVQDNSVVYTPTAGFSGTDEFTYSISDGKGGVADARVTVSVTQENRPPVAVDDFITTEQDSTVRFRPTDNDSDPDDDRIVVVSVTQPANGTAAFNGNSSRVVYVPNAAFSGIDTFTYTVEDSAGADATANVTITVTAP